MRCGQVFDAVQTTFTALYIEDQRAELGRLVGCGLGSHGPTSTLCLMTTINVDDYEAGEADWEVPISQPGQYPVTASTSSSVGRTLPRQLDPEFYARILRSSEPEAEFQVPIRAKWLHFSQLEPGHIFMINRPSWTVARSRASQKRLRGGEDQPCNGGWNR